jgi:protein TonB
MSDPMNNPPPPEPQRKGSSPLIWILVLIALIAFAWYFYNRQAGSEASADLTAPAATSDAMTPDASTPSSDDTAAARRAAAKKAPKQVAKAERPRSQEAVLLTQPRPSYPPEAYRAREEGTVIVQAEVDATGNASEVKVVRHSGSRTLDRAAISEVRKWKFRPAMENGKAVASSVQVPVDYKLADQ